MIVLHTRTFGARNLQCICVFVGDAHKHANTLNRKAREAGQEKQDSNNPQTLAPSLTNTPCVEQGYRVSYASTGIIATQI